MIRAAAPTPSLAQARAVAASVCDPEVPVLTIDDLGVLRGVRVHGDAIVVTGEPVLRALLDGRLRWNDAVAAGLVVVDIRNPGETSLGTIPGARLISLPSLLRRLDELDPAAPTVVYCAGGYRSAIASSLLRAHGFTDVSDLIGGYTAWVNATHPATAFA